MAGHRRYPGHRAGPQRRIGGAVASTKTWLSKFEFLGLNLRHTPVSFEQPPAVFDRQSRPIGRVGGAMLRNFRLTIDPKRGLLWAKWLPGSE